MKFLIFTVSSFPKKLFHRNNTSRSNSYSTRILKAFKITDIFCLKPSAIQFISVFLYFFSQISTVAYITSIHGFVFTVQKHFHRRIKFISQ